jgi:glycine oxidase
VVLAAGSWSTLVAGVPLQAGDVRPARGQIVELEGSDPLLQGVVFGPGCYLVPRDDGRVLVGSTLEFVGYRREVTARAVRDLLVAAIDLVPALADVSLGRTWSSFRPYSETGVPLLGPSEVERLLLATGHHRNGILLAPITAEIIRAATMGDAPPIDLTPFRR